MSFGLKFGVGRGRKFGAQVGLVDVVAEDLPFPVFVAAGDAEVGTGALTPELPAGIQAGDYLLLIVNNTFTISTGATLSDAQDFTVVPDTTIDSTFGGIHTVPTLFESVYVAGAAPTVADNGEYHVARIYAFRGASGYDSVTAAKDQDGDATLEILLTHPPSLGANRLVVCFITGFTQASGEVLSNVFINGGGLANLTELHNASYAPGEDIYLGAYTIEAAEAGAAPSLFMANWTGAGAYWVSAAVTIVLKP